MNDIKNFAINKVTPIEGCKKCNEKKKKGCKLCKKIQSKVNWLFFWTIYILIFTIWGHIELIKLIRDLF
jgi:hypothetical protein